MAVERMLMTARPTGTYAANDEVDGDVLPGFRMRPADLVRPTRR